MPPTQSPFDFDDNEVGWFLSALGTMRAVAVFVLLPLLLRCVSLRHVSQLGILAAATFTGRVCVTLMDEVEECIRVNVMVDGVPAPCLDVEGGLAVVTYRFCADMLTRVVSMSCGCGLLSVVSSAYSSILIHLYRDHRHDHRHQFSSSSSSSSSRHSLTHSHNSRY